MRCDLSALRFVFVRRTLSQRHEWWAQSGATSRAAWRQSSPVYRADPQGAAENAERALLNESLEGVSSTWTRQSAISGARLVAVTQPSPDLQQRKLAEDERQLFDHFDAESGIMEAYNMAVRCHSAWYRQDMEDLSGRIGFDYLEINYRIGNDYDQA